MKKSTLWTVFMLLAFAGTALAEGLLSYKATDWGLSMQYPKGWSTREEQKGAVVTFLAPIENDGGDKLRENVNVMVQDAQGMSLAQYTDYSKKQLQQMVQAADLERITDTTLGGAPAKRIEYTGRDNQGGTRKFLQVWTVKNGKAYLSTYTAEEEDFDKYVADAQNIINSIQLN